MVFGKDLAVVLAWPQCWAKAPEPIFEKLKKIGLFNSTYFRLGHAGILLIDGTNGQLEYFDFGRYSTDVNQGRVRSRRSDPKLIIDVRAEFDSNGDLENLSELLGSIKSKQEEMHGEGTMHVAVCKDFNFRQAKLFAESLQDAGSLDYGSVSLKKINCANFVQKVLLKGIECNKTKLRLRFPLTLFLPTPLGNVEAIRSPQNYLVTEQEVITKKRISQWAVVKVIYRSTIVNVTHKFFEVKTLNHLEPPVRNSRIPPEACWLGGQGEGTWMMLTVLKDKDNFYRIRGLAANGDTEYDFIATTKTQGFDAKNPYLFMPNCSRLGVTIIQEDRKIKLRHYQDFQEPF